MLHVSREILDDRHVRCSERQEEGRLPVTGGHDASTSTLGQGRANALATLHWGPRAYDCRLRTGDAILERDEGDDEPQ